MLTNNDFIICLNADEDLQKYRDLTITITTHGRVIKQITGSGGELIPITDLNFVVVLPPLGELSSTTFYYIMGGLLLPITPVWGLDRDEFLSFLLSQRELINSIGIKDALIFYKL